MPAGLCRTAAAGGEDDAEPAMGRPSPNFSPNSTDRSIKRDPKSMQRCMLRRWYAMIHAL